MTLAIRTVSETDDIHVIEGLGIPFGGPFNGSDTYRSRATKDTDFYWSLFPDVAPTDDAKRTAEVAAAARFIRPTTYQHGLDNDLGLTRVGGWSPIRTFDKGVWVQAQLDKHNQYYDAIRELLDKNALGFSIGSAEHSVRFDSDRNWTEWPAYELALTPTPSNPWAAIATRTAETAELFRIVAARKDDDPNVGDTPSAESTVVLEVPPEAIPAVRAGRRNSAGDQTLVDQIHDLTVRLGATAHPDVSDDQPNDDSPPAEPADDAARSGDPLPTLRIVEREDPAAIRAAQDEAAARIGREVAERFARRV